MATSISLVGTVLAGRYQLRQLLGQGGMGSVYEATDAQMPDRQVAVKVLAPHLVEDETQVIRFEQEARAANQLRHPNTISVLDFGRSPDGHVFMVLEYLHGDTLTRVIDGRPMPPVRALSIVRQICKSLAEAHAVGIIHRDLKPDNIFVCEIYGERDFIKVIDFGIAKLAVGGAELTQAGSLFGTPRYLSPEQVLGQPVTPTSDLYAVGVMLFEMLTGAPPFVSDDARALAFQHVEQPPPTLAEARPGQTFAPRLEQLVAKLLAKTADERFQSAEQVLAEVDAVLTRGAPVTPARPITVPARPVPPPEETGLEVTAILTAADAAPGIGPRVVSHSPAAADSKSPAPATPEPRAADGPNWVLAAGIAAVLAVLGGGLAWWLVSSPSAAAPPSPAPGEAHASVPPPAPEPPPLGEPPVAPQAALPGVPTATTQAPASPAGDVTPTALTTLPVQLKPRAKPVAVPAVKAPAKKPKIEW